MACLYSGHKTVLKLVELFLFLPYQRVVERRAGVAWQSCFNRSHCFQFLQLFLFWTELWLWNSIFTGIGIQIIWIIATPSHETQTEKRCRIKGKHHPIYRYYTAGNEYKQRRVFTNRFKHMVQFEKHTTKSKKKKKNDTVMNYVTAFV